MTESVTLFTRPGDAQCAAAARYLDEKKVAYTARDITQDPSASAVLFGKLGKIVVPTFLIGDRMIVGFDPVQLLRYLPKDESQEEHVAFGAAVRTLSPEVAKAGGLTAAFGVEIGDVKEDSPAGKAGIRKGDIITAIGAYTLTGGAQQFRTAIGAKRPGDNMTVTVWRDGEEIAVDITFPRSRTGVTAPLFTGRYPVIAVLHLLPLPGAPRFGGSMPDVIARMTSDLDAYKAAGVDGVIVENFADVPFFPDRVPTQTIESITAAAEVARQNFEGPMGINVLRTDALSALEIAAKVGAQFIRVNVHMHPVVSEQGTLVGRSHETLRRRAELKANVQIWADAAVKHGRPLVEIPLADEVRDLVERGCADAVIISGSHTGISTRPADVATATSATDAPIYIGSGVTRETVGELSRATGFIVGSSLKRDGVAGNEVEPGRVQSFMEAVSEQRNRS